MSATRTPLSISPLATASDATAFRTINEEWISRLFTLTDEDRRLLGDPVGQIISGGGDVLLARTEDGEAVGCVALLSYDDGVYELAKMGVTPNAQGTGVGRSLVAAAIARTAERGGRKIFLGTNSRLEPAIHLYEAAGFRRIGREELPVSDYYARADTLMELSLEH
jgi:ribosomal protein S18 acetylase RimI-like enzyme